MLHSSFVEINKSALQHNLKFLRKIIGPDRKYSSVIKGNAYGHGIPQFVPLAEECGVDHFSVFSADEAENAFKAKKESSEIMIMGMISDDEVEWAVEHDISFYVFDFERIDAAINAAKKLQKKARIHIEIETGLHRTGFDKKHISKVSRKINDASDYLEVEGICTHYAGAESIGNYVRVMDQIKNYKELTSAYEKEGIIPKYKHTACSAPTFRYPESMMDMVRIGIAQYGYWPSKETYIHYSVENKTRVDPLKRVISWKSKIMSIKEVSTGNYINYGTSFQASRDMRIATVPVGYCHGFSRSLSNLGRVLINGRRISVIGVVNMNMIVVDITSHKSVQKDDEVVLIGKQNKNSLTLSSFSDLTNKLNYESLVRLPAEIPRIIV